LGELVVGQVRPHSCIGLIADQLAGWLGLLALTDAPRYTTACAHA
jgi:hypothetical protein